MSSATRTASILPAISAAVLLAAVNPVIAADPIRPSDSAGIEFFEKRIRPLLAENCYRCHGAQRQRSGLALESREAILRGGDRGPVIVPSQPDESLLIRAIRYSDNDLRMPPRGKLREDQIADLVEWVRQGTPGPTKAGSDSTSVQPSDHFDLAERRRHWSYLPIDGATIPAVDDSVWCTSPVDFFILNDLESAGLSPAAPADKRTLIRRLSLDLIGMPPSRDEVEALLADTSPNAYERLVERLLASPHYGERWARHWLDVVRYCETLGFEFDYDLHNAWRYRDYVIRAWNDDQPYDQFVVEHLAGDLLPQPRRHSSDRTNESILATGFFWMGEGRQTPVDIRQEQADRIDNQIDVLCKALLGQTVACARCHDHKFDAISTRDYYSLAGYLKSSRYQQAFIDPPERISAKVEQLAALRIATRELVADERGHEWRERLAQASRYLMAAAQSDKNTALEAGDFGLDSALLKQWVTALDEKSIDSLDHPLYAWVQLAKRTESGSETFAQRKETLRAALKEQEQQATRALAAAQTFEDFQHPAYEGWYVTGDAFGTGPVRAGDIILGDKSTRPVARLAFGGADSGLFSSRLQGELRSRSFTIDKPYLHYRLAGRDARLNLVIDGYTLIMNPMYGKLTIKAQSDHLAWQTMPVDRWIGQRAFIEVSDSNIPMYGLNPPPSTARVPDGPDDGYIIVEQVLLSENPEPPRMPNRLNCAALDRTSTDSLEALAAVYGELMLEELQRWLDSSCGAKVMEGGSDGLALLNWLLEHGLLDSAPGASAHSDQGRDPLIALQQEHRAIEATLPAPQRAPALADGTGEDEFVALRGNYRTPGEPALRRLPEVLYSEFEPCSNPGSGRLELARQLVHPSNPLLARVMVNRIWQHHFGEGLVRTPDDFGRMGQPPSHPELLDWLAAEFMRRGWSIKDMHRLMVLSSTYRQSSEIEVIRNPELVDPENRLLHRMPVRRLEGETIRDAVLAVSGRLDETLYGPSVLPYLTPHMEGRGRPNPGPLDGDGRRSIYLNARRNFLTPLFLAFDYPIAFSSTGRRGVSTIPAQPLALMNDPFVIQQAERWAQNVRETGGTRDQSIEALYQAAFMRSPSPVELEAALLFLERQGVHHGGSSDDPRAWTDLCHVLINVKGFIFFE